MDPIPIAAHLPASEAHAHRRIRTGITKLMQHVVKLHSLRHDDTELMHKIAQQIPGTRRTQCLQGRNSQRVITNRLYGIKPRQFVQQLTGLGKMLCAAAQCLAVGGESLGELREQAVAHKVARIAVIRVALVLYPLQAKRPCAGNDLFSCSVQQGHRDGANLGQCDHRRVVGDCG